ncbi:hypothetical protein ABIF90_007163 [Bradyrhizobium japonicum]
MPRRISVWPPARPTQWGSPRPSIFQCRDSGLQRRRVEIRIRAPAVNSISIDPLLLAGATGQGIGPDSGTTIADTTSG